MMAGASALGSALATPAAGPSSADSVFGTNLKFNNSGWNVTFGGGDIDSNATDAADFGGATGQSQSLDKYLPYGILFVGALIAWKMLKK